MNNVYIEQAKVMTKGQITIPQEIRKILKVGVGDRVSFIVNGDEVIIANSAICALKLLQNEMEGETKKAGIYSKEDVQKILEENK